MYLFIVCRQPALSWHDAQFVCLELHLEERECVRVRLFEPEPVYNHEGSTDWIVLNISAL